jgi:hypothetical protein
MAYTFINKVSTIPLNSNVGYNNSWLEVENNANRELFAQASYITNFDDLTISLSAGNVTIGAVEIKDGNSNLKADVTESDGLNALRVLTQDLESSVDDITIGDKQGNFVTIQMPQSALRVYPVTTAGGFTRCETRSSGNPTFISDQIFIHNSSNSNVYPILTLTQGTSCRLAVGKSTETNHTLTLNLAVSGVNDYAGCEITFFA